MRDTKINLALCAAGELFGGVERFVYSLARQLTYTSEIMTIVVLFHEAELCRKLRKAGIETIVVRSRRKYDARVVRELVRLFKSRGVNIVHTNGYKATIFGAVAGKACGASVVKTEHGLMEPRKRRNLDWLKMRGNLFADGIVSRSLADHVIYVTRDLRRAFGIRHDGRASIIHNGIAPIPRATNIPDDIDAKAFNVGLIGRLSEVKGHRVLFAATERLLDLPDLVLNIFGEGPLKRQLRESCLVSGLNDRVNFHGFKDNIYDYIQALDLLVMPSLHEGLPYALLESMYLGVPVVASNVGGLCEILEHERDCLLVEPGNALMLAEAIRRLYGDKALRLRLAENGRQKIIRDYMAAEMAREYRDVYRTMLWSREKAETPSSDTK